MIGVQINTRDLIIIVAIFGAAALFAVAVPIVARAKNKLVSLKHMQIFEINVHKLNTYQL